MTPAIATSAHFMLQPSLKDLHVKTLAWESSLKLWKRELCFFQKLIDRYGRDLHGRTDVEEREHFRLLLNYYNDELMNSLEQSMFHHEANLKELLSNGIRQDEAAYRNDHRELEHQISAFQEEFSCYKNELYLLVEKVVQKYKRKNGKA